MNKDAYAFWYFRRKAAEMLRRSPHSNVSVALFLKWEQQSYNNNRPDLPPMPPIATGMRLTPLLRSVA